VTEREMEDLLWQHPEKFLNEPLKQFERQPASAVGRADLVFEDRIGRLIVIELKRDTLERGAITQLVDYFGMLKGKYPGRAVELMVIASRIPPERRIACEQYDIEAREIPQKRFRDVAGEVGYTFKSESQTEQGAQAETRIERHNEGIVHAPVIGGLPAKVERAWYLVTIANGPRYFAAFVNARGSCSIRLFDTVEGRLRRREYKSGDFQDSFADYLQSAVPLHVSRKPNLERDCKVQLPTTMFAELSRQIPQ
jgi:hypothetical protein